MFHWKLWKLYDREIYCLKLLLVQSMTFEVKNVLDDYKATDLCQYKTNDVLSRMFACDFSYTIDHEYRLGWNRYLTN